MTKILIEKKELEDLVYLATEIEKTTDPLESDYTRTIKVGRLVEKVHECKSKYLSSLDVARLEAVESDGEEQYSPFMDTPSFKKALNYSGYTSKVERKNAKDFEDLFNELQRKNLAETADDRENYVIEISRKNKKNKKVKK